MTSSEEAFAALERSVHAALETYSNVHRGSGHASLVTTHLYEQAREIVREHLGPSARERTVVFCSPARADALTALLRPGSYECVSSREIGLPLGVTAVAVERGALPRGVPFQSGGGTARLVARDWVVWTRPPERFEAGTPAIVNVIAFAAALRLIRQHGGDAFRIAGDGGGESDLPAPNAASAADILYRDDLERFAGRELLDHLRQTRIGRELRVPTAHGTRPFVNLDNAASTPTFEPVWDAVRSTWRLPSEMRAEVVREATSVVAESVGAPLSDYDVIFASNTTEAINVVARSLGSQAEPGVETVVVNTILEHNSNELPWRTMPGMSLARLPVDADGFVDLDQMEALLRSDNHGRRDGRGGSGGTAGVRLVAVSGASNVIGTCNDLEEIGRIAHRHGARFLVDAAQLIARRKVDMERCGIDCLAFSAHKVYAPFGTGVLVVRKGMLSLPPAEIERVRSSGAENVGGIAALAKSLILLDRIGLDVIQADEQALTARAIAAMAQIPRVKLYGIRDPDSPRFARRTGVIAFDVDGMLPSRVAAALAEEGGIGTRYGCHCAHLLVKHLVGIKPVLEQLQRLIVMLLPRLNLPGVVRVSLGLGTTDADIDAFLDSLRAAATPNRAKTPGDVRKSIQEFVGAASARVYPPVA